MTAIQQNPPQQKKQRSGSEKRQRQWVISVRVHDHERASIAANAAEARLCTSSFLRVVGSGSRRPREWMPELKPFSQAMGRLGIYMSNAYQLLRLANRGEIPEVEELREAAAKIDLVAEELLKIIRPET